MFYNPTCLWDSNPKGHYILYQLNHKRLDCHCRTVRRVKGQGLNTSKLWSSRLHLASNTLIWDPVYTISDTGKGTFGQWQGWQTWERETTFFLGFRCRKRGNRRADTGMRVVCRPGPSCRSGMQLGGLEGGGDGGDGDVMRRRRNEGGEGEGRGQRIVI